MEVDKCSIDRVSDRTKRAARLLPHPSWLTPAYHAARVPIDEGCIPDTVQNGNCGRVETSADRGARSHGARDAIGATTVTICEGQMEDHSPGKALLDVASRPVGCIGTMPSSTFAITFGTDLLSSTASEHIAKRGEESACAKNRKSDAFVLKSRRRATQSQTIKPSRRAIKTSAQSAAEFCKLLIFTTLHGLTTTTTTAARMRVEAMRPFNEANQGS